MARLIDNLDKVDLKRLPSGFKTKIISKDPYVVVIDNFVSPDEIKGIFARSKYLEKSGKGFEKSTIIVDGESILSTTRTSETLALTSDGQVKKYNPQIEALLKRVRYLIGCKRNEIEELLLVKYEVGQYYYNHHDFFRPEDKEYLDDGGQRIMTFFLYLNDVEEGGETTFPKLKLRISPKAGRAVFWHNVKDGETIDETLHRGDSVKKGTKYGINIWIRDHGWKA